MVVLVTCKNEEDRIKNEGTRVATRSYVDFSGAQGQITPKWWDLAEIRTHSSFYECACYLQELRRSNQK